jgi:hypothetical protein
MSCESFRRYEKLESLLNERYHHLNHFSIFGGSYKRGAVSIMEKLVKKYA